MRLQTSGDSTPARGNIFTQSFGIPYTLLFDRRKLCPGTLQPLCARRRQLSLMALEALGTFSGRLGIRAELLHVFETWPAPRPLSQGWDTPHGTADQQS